ncbi:hypothetical protein BN439_2198 [Erwinia amylovora Ea644]|nr:hypothetical protein BN439_2198 [Erwinia amylovora Ea644]CCP07259.1 hypothetical protein BN440_2236 [Erwinia amylovora MR1]
MISGEMLTLGSQDLEQRSELPFIITLDENLKRDDFSCKF